MTKKMMYTAVGILVFVFLVFILTAFLFGFGLVTELWLLIVSGALFICGLSANIWFFFHYSSYVCLTCGIEHKPKKFWSWFFAKRTLTKRKILCPKEKKMRWAQLSCFVSKPDSKPKSEQKG